MNSHRGGGKGVAPEAQLKAKLSKPWVPPTRSPIS